MTMITEAVYYHYYYHSLSLLLPLSKRSADVDDDGGACLYMTKQKFLWSRIGEKEKERIFDR